MSSKNPEESFVFVPHLTGNDEITDFVVTRTNWFNRRQIRILRLAKDKFMRVEPTTEGTGIVKDSWPYTDIFELVQLDASNLVIK